MKKFDVFRKCLLTVPVIAAMIFAGSCSKDPVVEPDGAGTALETRATPELTISCTPDAIGEGKNLLSQKETYRFVGTVRIMNGFGLVQNKVCPLRFRAADGSAEDFEVTENSNLYGECYDVKFFKPGYYYVTVEYTDADGTSWQQTWTYCVVSRAKSVTLPDKIELGVPFDLSFEFYDERYPAPTLKVIENLFDNPQYAILANDGHGKIRLRIDQPGEYIISTGLGGIFSAWADIKLYWRPEFIFSESLRLFSMDTGEYFWSNVIMVNDISETLPIHKFLYNLYFKYELKSTFNTPFDAFAGEKLVTTVSRGGISMPDTSHKIDFIRKNWALERISSGYYWELTIPDDTFNWFCVREPDDTIVVDPENPGGGVVGPIDPGFPIRP